MLTRVFKSGNSLAVRIPKELSFPAGVQDVEIERVGNTLVLRPAQRETLAELSAVLASFPKGFMTEGREFHEQKARNWGPGWGGAEPAPTRPAQRVRKG